MNIELPRDPAIPLLATHPRERKTSVHTKTCTQMFTAALFVKAKTWKQPKCPSTGIVVHPHNGIVLSNKKRRIDIHTTTWMKYKIIILRGQARRVHTA